jgi:hypothetical protein
MLRRRTPGGAPELEHSPQLALHGFLELERVKSRLHPSGPQQIPVFGAYGDLLAQQRPGTGAAPVPFSKGHAAGRGPIRSFVCGS